MQQNIESFHDLVHSFEAAPCFVFFLSDCSFWFCHE
jgi:hypothetical protein